jgi:YbgC/YbaW family acyl-CoA thioester hydrolase
VPLSEHRYHRRVQFAETDMAGVVHFANFLRYLEEAEHALWREAGLSIVPPGSEIGFPRVAASLEFHAPLYFEDEFEVHIRVAAISRRSIRYVSTIMRGDTKIASGTVTALCVRNSPRPMRAIDLPGDIAGRFAVSDAV